uniref:Uncharacterized protein n=1 Tax=Haptolina brevifila TaxID=156173 RepID=A0A7S2GRY0_9EUKA
MAHMPHTPLVFVIQDDTQVGPGGIDVEMLYRMFTFSSPLVGAHNVNSGGSARVEYVRLADNADCLRDRRSNSRDDRRMIAAYVPCMPHPTTSLLHQTNRWLDRPHLATRQHYDERLFRSLHADAKVTPEQMLDQRSRLKGAKWPLWVYGRRGEMLRDLHWPLKVNGVLIGKERVAELVRLGQLNVSLQDTYAHSYLLHAYRGKDQDVGEEQIQQRKFRRRNPLSWYAQDRLSGSDER